MQVIYHQNVIDRTGVDAANRIDRMTARSIIAEMEQVGQERIGYDADGRWHDPQIDGLHMDCQVIRERRQDHSQHGTGIVRGVLLSIPIWIAIIWAVVHFAQKAGLPW